jgi:predicted ATPase
VATKLPTGNLPAELNSFVGRRSEVSAIRRLLSTARLVTLTGTGGVGKTRLALRVATGLRRTYTDGVWLVELAGLTDASLVPRTVSAALGAIDQRPIDPVDGLIAYLADRKVLIVLDNCEHLLRSCADLVARLLDAAPSLQILATSRSRLGLSFECNRDVSPLRVPESDETAESKHQHPGVQLFVDRAAAVSPGFQVTADISDLVGHICQRLDGIPLALELAAARLRALSLDQLAARLDDRFRLLTAGNRAALPRHQTLRAAVKWSFDLCTPAEQRMWERGSVFAGRFDLAAAEQVCRGDGLPVNEVAEALRGLVDKSVVIAEEREGLTWYRMLETVREFGLAELRSPSADTPAVTEAALRERHHDFYVDLAERFDSDWFGPRQRWWCEYMHTVLPDLRAAFTWCLTVDGESAAGQRLAGALFYFWYGCGELREGLHWLERVLAGDPASSRHRMRALAAYARVLNLLGRPADAVHPAMECLAYLHDKDDAWYESCALQSLGIAQLNTGEPRALSTLKAAAARAADLPPAHPARAMTLVGLAVGMLFDGDPVRACELLDESAAICRHHNEVWWQGHSLGTAVLPLLTIGDVGRATEVALDGLRLAVELRYTLGMMLSVQVIAWTFARAGEFQRAARLIGASDYHMRTAGGSPIRGGTWAQAQHDCEAACREALGGTEFDVEVQRGWNSASKRRSTTSWATAEPRTSPRVGRSRPVTRCV